MKFALSWLKQHLETQADAATIARALTALGLEIEGVSDASAALGAFRVARVLTAERHPQADKLQVLSVDIGDGTPLQVVCGAPNARAGLIGVLGLPGAVVPANGMELRKSAIRGVESNGMMCSTRELGLGDEHDGIIELPADAPLGISFAHYLGSDPVFDVAITPNRPDCMGVYGIARDLAAAGIGTLRPIAVDHVPGSYPCPIDVRTDDPEGCPAFYGRVIRGVRNGPSPQWLADALKSAGQRPISALVDITNYVMLAYGRPAHAYDLAKLRGAVVARKAVAGETVHTLNGREYTLDATMTVIADDVMVHDVAGIMGGEHSGCSDATTDVLLEVAYFDRQAISRTGQALALTSDARSRFERGVDPGFLDTGLDLLTALICQICGGEPSHVVRAGEPPLADKLVAYDPALAARLGGIDVPQAEQRRILDALGFGVSGEGLWRVAVPGWRCDIDAAPDIVEEVIRVHGLDAVPSTPLPRAPGVAKPTATPAQTLERRLRRLAAARGSHEAVTWSFLPWLQANHFADLDNPVWHLANPISKDLEAMRPSLLPGLLMAVQRNLDRGATSIRLFEIGRRYLRGADGASAEAPSLAVVLAGERHPRGWAQGKAAPFDAFDAKAEALALLAEAGAPVDNLMVMGEAGAQFHPGQSATLRLGPKTVLARFGMVHPATLKAFDLAGPVAVVELFLDRLPAKKTAGSFARAAYAPPPLQAVTRDFAFLLPIDRPAGDLVRAVRGADKANIVAARVFDDFRGAGVPEGQRSLAIEITLQPVDKSYDEAALKAIAERVVAAAAKLGGTLRG
ncbi:phenylalanine--tRNA ligase subunit beta [Novosphingobium sp. FSW06-99]|uniref:phenylalanine--tRNA ligase subunit beta n=1 Tax=Novosphingobium sp. FSW06-99 TaxID=1739113 RepID=UPI00076BD5B0|nr:phenylalanine--tRNA ligase subunit beta [Novosphingobium sp. FSW06-99]KUR76399.1 phenylalanine--tRNA ligase subunit beta [Novosphingobium sp. FSW06-99]